MSRISDLAGFTTSLSTTEDLSVGIVTASQFVGDGSNLTGLPAGLGTALSSDDSSPLSVIYYTDKILAIGSTITIDVPSTATVAYTQYREVEVTGDADLIVADGDEFMPDIFGYGHKLLVKSYINNKNFRGRVNPNV